MNIFKIGRGDFFGIIIPGAFLLINIALLYRQTFEKLFYGELKGSVANSLASMLPPDSYAVLLPMLFVLSYALGFALRVIQPSTADKISLPLRIVVIGVKSSVKKLVGAKPSRTFREKLHAHLEPFPYIDSFFGRHLEQAPESYRRFYEELRKTEFKDDQSLMKGLVFINECKMFVYNRSAPLRDEIVFCEGIVRFVSGMIFALIFSIVSILLFATTFVELLYVYAFILALFLLKLRHMRTKEVATIFDALAFTAKQETLC